MVLTATFMPMYPARSERSTPHMNATEVVQPKKYETSAANQGITRKMVFICLLR